MWTVEVVLPDDTTEEYADPDRFAPDSGTQAYAYRYAIDEASGVLRVFRRLLHWDSYYQKWDRRGGEAEVAYYKPDRWERVRGT